MKATFQLQKPDVWTWRSRLWRLRWWRLRWWRLRWWRLCWWRLRRHRFELLLLFGCHQALQPLYSLYSFTCRQGKGIPFWYATVAFEQLPFAPVAFEPYLGQKKRRERETYIYSIYVCVFDRTRGCIHINQTLPLCQVQGSEFRVRYTI